MSLQVTQFPIYDNHLLLDPRGNFMCYIGRKRSEWYLENNLAELVSENPITIKLSFEPKGPGHVTRPYLAVQRENICAICGSTELLTRHHIVPYQYRVIMPDMYKMHNHYDVVPMCLSCHVLCEKKYNKLKGKLSSQVGSHWCVPEVEVNRDMCYAVKSAHALLKYGHKIPEHKRNNLIIAIEKAIGREMYEHDLYSLSNVSHGHYMTTRHEHASKVLEAYPNLDDFFILWRKFFIEQMQPKFMPDGWDVNVRISEEWQ